MSAAGVVLVGLCAALFATTCASVAITLYTRVDAEVVADDGPAADGWSNL